MFLDPFLFTLQMQMPPRGKKTSPPPLGGKVEARVFIGLSYVAFELQCRNCCTMENKTLIPYLQVRSKGLVYYELLDPPSRHRRHDLSRYQTYSGEVTDHAARRIARTVDIFLQRSPVRTITNTATGYRQKFQLSFITLTIPDSLHLEAKETHKALKVFIQHFRRSPGRKAISEQMRSYLWKCELQQRGQIHYHLTTNVFLHFGEIRRVWNGILFNRGWMNDFIAANGHTNPNSTDVHSVYKVKDIGAYLSKYLAKTGTKDVSEYGFPQLQYVPNVGGKVWDCSEDLKTPYYSMVLDSETKDKIQTAINFQSMNVTNCERCVVFRASGATRLLGVAAAADYANWRGF